MFVGADLGVDLPHHALLVDDEGPPLGEADFAEHAERLGGLLVGVGKKREVEVLLLRELLLGFQVVGADADDHGILLSELLSLVAERAVLDRSALGHGLREEEQHHVLPF